MVTQIHPYFPADLHIEAGYIPNAWSVPKILACFVACIAAAIGVSLVLARRVRRDMTGGEQAVFGWFILCAFLHCFFEGYWIQNHQSIPSSQALFAQLWKEYALSDSRYMVSDPFMLCIETLTVYIWAPLSFLAAQLIVFSPLSSTRYMVQTIISVGHLYGVTLYFGTCYFMERYAGVAYNRPEPLYYWVYYFGLNVLWAVVPSYLLVDAARKLRVRG